MCSTQSILCVAMVTRAWCITTLNTSVLVEYFQRLCIADSWQWCCTWPRSSEQESLRCFWSWLEYSITINMHLCLNLPWSRALNCRISAGYCTVGELYQQIKSRWNSNNLIGRVDMQFSIIPDTLMVSLNCFQIQVYRWHFQHNPLKRMSDT